MSATRTTLPVADVHVGGERDRGRRRLVPADIRSTPPLRDRGGTRKRSPHAIRDRPDPALRRAVEGVPFAP